MLLEEADQVEPVVEAEALPTYFTAEQKILLRNRKYTIFNLNQESMTTLEKKGMRFWSTWHVGNSNFESLSSRKGEVAVLLDPDKFFLADSNNKTYQEQVDMVKEYSLKIQQKISGVEAIIGNAADYLELAFLNANLFGEEYKRHYTRSNTPTFLHFALVGNRDLNGFLSVPDWASDARDPSIWVAPLVVPL